MPLIECSEYVPSRLFRSGHLQTIYASRFRRVHVRYDRQRLELPDGDFLDLDWIRVKSDRAVILCHGCESSTEAPYMKGMAQAFSSRGWDVLALNFRGCSGVPNRLYRSYHSGDTDDLEETVAHVERQGYASIAIVGFSLGGNTVLKYAGEGRTLSAVLKCFAAVSVPCDLRASAELMAKPSMVIYMEYFMHSLRAKMRSKTRSLPPNLSLCDFDSMRSFREFDDAYTGPSHGFRDAEDYWAHCNCLQFLPNIERPTLLINAADDPFLPPECFPLDEAKKSTAFHLEVPERGGHVGFISLNGSHEYWHETRVVDFIGNAAKA
ncbi:MAG: alpha/beta fold hydrolase [Planctomycetota bacterium]|nr:alpha/beta fold hydrolase [Planctomycetota bacterium]MDA1137178.1 alpha/beta fold hydrolase [Planctomycetota bacterium]